MPERVLALLADAERAAPFSARLAESIVARIDERLAELGETERARVRGACRTEPASRPPLALWVEARVLGLLGDAPASCARWDACLDALPRVEPEALLLRSRARLAAGLDGGASSDLREALRHGTTYALWQRADPVLRKLRARTRPASRRSLKVAVLSGKGSVALLTPILELGCFRDEIDASCYVSDYDAMFREVLDPGSGLYRFEPDVVLFATHWRDAELPAFAPDPEAAVAVAAERFLTLFRTLRARLDATVVAHGFDLPGTDPYGRLGTTLDGGRGAMLRALQARLRGSLPDGVVLLDLESVAGRVGSAWEDPRQWYAAKQHPASAGLVELVERVMGVLRALLGLTRKVLVLDLDNLLWGGVIGEEGLEGIELGPPSAAGEAYQDLQRYALKLKERGVLLAVCSKNNEADAKQPFLSHPETVLRLGDFVAFAANWDDKATNLERLATTLSLGLDSFVFLDDNPVERQWVRQRIPELTVPELPEDPSRYVEILDRGRYFEAIAISAEDRARHEQYRGNVQRQELEAASSSMEEFLGQLGMVAESGPFDERNLARVAQLVNKTNQFNLTTRRYTESQLSAQAADPAWWTRWFRLADRYGDNGLIGVLTLKPRAGEASASEIDTWLISCRVLGRRMDAFMLRAALAHLGAMGRTRLYGAYRKTAKNGQVQDLLPRFGFALVGEREDATEYVVEVARVPLPEIPIAGT